MPSLVPVLTQPPGLMSITVSRVAPFKILLTVLEIGFNYSANPTYVSGSKIVTKRFAKDQPVSYLTTVGLYSADNELLAVAKVSEPLRKDPNTELTLRVRLDY